MKASRRSILKSCDIDDRTFSETCQAYDVPEHVVLAMILVESAANPYAMRYEKHFRWIHEPEAHAARLGVTVATERELQKFSYGVLQIMGGTARGLGFAKPLTLLNDPIIGLSWAVLYFGRLRRKYESTEQAISAYNQGSPRRSLLTGKYKNQEYVDKVLRRAEHLEG